MLIKTPRFDSVLLNNLWMITINKNKPLILKGSYKLKDYGSIITDIDFQSMVYFSDSLIDRLLSIFDTIRNPYKYGDYQKFYFMNFKCGIYDGFELPWKITPNGGCEFDPEKVDTWFDNFKKQNLVPKEIIDYMGKRLNGKEISLKDLSEIELKLESYMYIIWTEEDIKRRYIEKNNKRYDIIDQMKKSSLCVIKYLYRYNYIDETTGKSITDFCLVDLGMVGIDHKKNPFFQQMHFYYAEDWYKVFKSYKFFVEDEYKEDYKNVMKGLEIYSALYNRVKMISKIIKYNLLPREKNLILFLMDDCRFYMDKIGMDYKGKRPEELDHLLYDMMRNYTKQYLDFFRSKIKPNKKLEYNVYYDRGIYATNKKLSKDDLKKRYNEGNHCPFFDIDVDDFNMIYSLSERLLLDSKNVIKCLSELGEKMNMTIHDILSETVKSNNYYILSSEGKLLLKNLIIDGRNKIIEDMGIYEVGKIEKLRLFILTENRMFLY